MIRTIKTISANTANGCILNDSVKCPCSSNISDRPNPQPGQCSNPARLNRQMVKCSPDGNGETAKYRITAIHIKASRL